MAHVILGEHADKLTVRLTEGDGASLLATVVDADGVPVAWSGTPSLEFVSARTPDDDPLSFTATVDGSVATWTLTQANVTAIAAASARTYVRPETLARIILPDAGDGTVIAAGPVDWRSSWESGDRVQTVSFTTAGGPPGAPGASAYEIAVENGFVGTEAEWLASLGGGGGGGGAVTSVAGRTGAVVLTKADVGLANVDNTSDANKPVSTAQAAADAAVQAAAIQRANHTGTQSADTLTDGTTNKAFLATERTKLAGIATGATANATDAQLRDRSTHTGTQSADTLTDGTTNKAFLATERTKLAGIATGATANSSDATLLARANHTGTQAISTVTGLQTALDGLAPIRATINAQTGTTYTLVLSDENKLVTLTNAGAITVTLPSDASVAIPIGGRIDFAVLGAGMATFVAGSGATANGTPSLVTRAQYSAASAIKVAANTWLVVGDLA